MLKKRTDELAKAIADAVNLISIYPSSSAHFQIGKCDIDRLSFPSKDVGYSNESGDAAQGSPNYYFQTNPYPNVVDALTPKAQTAECFSANFRDLGHSSIAKLPVDCSNSASYGSTTISKSQSFTIPITGEYVRLDVDSKTPGYFGFVHALGTGNLSWTIDMTITRTPK